MEETENKSRGLITLGIAVLLLGVVLFFAFFYNDSKIGISRSSFDSSLEKGRDLHKTGNYDESISEFRKLIDKSPGVEDEARVKSMIAFDLYLRNKPGDLEEAVGIYKSIINDPYSPPLSKALAVSDMAAVLAPQDEGFISKNLNQEPFISFMAKDGGKFDRPLFLQKLYEYSDQIFPTSLAKFSAAYYISRRISDTMPAEEKKKSELAIQNYLKDGDGKVNEVVYYPGNLTKQYFYRAVAMQTNLKYFGSPSFEEVENAYKKAVEFGELDPSEASFSLAQTRLFYMRFLVEVSKVDRSNDVKMVMGEFLADSAKSRIETYILDFKDAPESSPFKMFLNKLGRDYPEFSTYLKSIGWN